jgi:thiamine transport system permease protein
LALAGIALFIGIAVAALLGFDTGQAPTSSILDPYIGRVLRFTLLQAVLSTLLSVGLALPVALALARRPRFSGRIWIVRLMAIPMGLPVLIGALGLIGIWGRQGIVNSALSFAGVSQPVSIYGLFGILLAHVFFNLPLACRLMLAGLERVPGEYWLVASGLGMKPLSIFRFIEWPAIRRLMPGIAGLIFMLCATSFTLVLTLGGGPAATTIEVAIYQSLRFDFDPARAIALSLLQIGMTTAILAAMALFPAPDDRAATAGRITRRFDGRGFLPTLADGSVILLATVLVGSPLLMIVAAGLRANLASLVTSPIFLRATLTSLAISLSAGLLAVLVATAIIQAQAAIADLRHRGMAARGYAASLSATTSLVLLVPPVVLGTGWFLALRPFGDVARFAPVLIVLINVLMALPFVMRVLAPAFSTHRQRTSRLAASLGVSGIARLARIDAPLLAKPMLMALSFAMALSLGDLGAVALFGSDSLVTLPWLIYSRMGSYRTNDADGLALILGLICLVLTIAGTAIGAPHEKDDDRG